jgi:hypothetical protein
MSFGVLGIYRRFNDVMMGEGYILPGRSEQDGH